MERVNRPLWVTKTFFSVDVGNSNMLLKDTSFPTVLQATIRFFYIFLHNIDALQGWVDSTRCKIISSSDDNGIVVERLHNPSVTAIINPILRSVYGFQPNNLDIVYFLLAYMNKVLSKNQCLQVINSNETICAHVYLKQ